MKKLLSILGASTMVISAPLSVVSCKKQKVTTGDEFDYVELLNQFLAEITLIFEKQIQKSFSEYIWINQDQLPEDMTIESIRAANENNDFQNHESDFYQKMLSLIRPIIPVEQINQEINESIVNDVNYNPILIDKSTPLKNGVEIQEISFIDKTKAVTIGVKFSALVFYKDARGEKTSQTITANVSFNIFEDSETAITAKEMDDAYIELINKDLANQWTFFSDSGNLENTSAAIGSGEFITEQFSKELEVLNEINKNVSVVFEDLKMVVNNKMIVNSARFEPFFNWQNKDERWKTFYKALSNDFSAEKEFLENILNNGDWIQPINLVLMNKDKEKWDPLANASYELYTKKDNNSSTYINQYNLAYNLSKNKQINKVIQLQNSDFDLDLKGDFNSIALFGINVNDLKFKIGIDDFDFSSQTIIARQKTTKNNTMELYNYFMTQAYNFQKSFINLQETPNLEVKKTAYLKVPKEWDLDSMRNKRILYNYEMDQQLVLANTMSSYINNDLEFSTSIFLDKYNYKKNKYNKYIWINDKNDLFFLDKDVWGEEAMNQIIFTTYYFSDSANNNLSFDMRQVIENTNWYWDDEEDLLFTLTNVDSSFKFEK
ncbi:lipoprotein [Spiroplasma alleghenense]|uniref:Lipoprotein n=1 Tax=Spiroplasma alleghenense TaxID=216931 RepID=A0A345Z579_9MOLU|nr:lipoprotein [Spiroplasma alleghenense]AXK51758.1 hypothetical protein SALLE_v1c10880 [Spiroplasma alleghenense]